MSQALLPGRAFVLVAGGEEIGGLGAGIAEVLGDGLVGDLVHTLGHHHSQAPATGHGAPGQCYIIYRTRLLAIERLPKRSSRLNFIEIFSPPRDVFLAPAVLGGGAGGPVPPTHPAPVQPESSSQLQIAAHFLQFISARKMMRR